MNNLKLSVITVTYNCKEDLRFTLDSVFSQTYKNFEYILIDGASTDGTVGLIQQEQDRIDFWMSEPDKGIYDAMNKALEKAKGEYVLFLNAGDEFYSSKTLEGIGFEMKPHADFFFGETVILNEKREELGLRLKKLPKDLNWRHFRKGMVVCHQSVIVRKSIAPTYNLSYRCSADVEWVLLSLQRSKERVFVEAPISKFVEGGFSTEYRKLSWYERKRIMVVYFGSLKSLAYHVLISLEYMLMKMGFTKKYRKL